METKKKVFVSIMKERIISESILSLRREGLRFSVDTLAQRLNISKKTIYKYFPDKEALALALFQKYYKDANEEMHSFLNDNSEASHLKLISLYFDAKSITCRDIFNKYKLNETLRLYTSKENDKLLDVIFSSFGDEISEENKISLQIIINGSFDKICNEKITPDGVIKWLVNVLW